MCHCKAITKIVVGLLLLLNAFVWPLWIGIDGWISFIAVLMVIGGVALLFKGKHRCSDPCYEVPAAKKKK